MDLNTPLLGVHKVGKIGVTRVTFLSPENNAMISEVSTPDTIDKGKCVYFDV